MSIRESLSNWFKGTTSVKGPASRYMKGGREKVLSGWRPILRESREDVALGSELGLFFLTLAGIALACTNLFAHFIYGGLVHGDGKIVLKAYTRWYEPYNCWHVMLEFPHENHWCQQVIDEAQN